MDTTAAILKARLLTESVTPLKTDCGRCCGSLCCLPDEHGKGGMLLFPGEETLYKDTDDFVIQSDSSLIPDGKLLICKGNCRRNERPLACRFFPLRPSIRHTVCIDRRSLSICPLAEQGLQGLDDDFINAARAAAETLMQNPLHRDFIKRLGLAIIRSARENHLQSMIEPPK